MPWLLWFFNFACKITKNFSYLQIFWRDMALNAQKKQVTPCLEVTRCRYARILAERWT